MTFWFTQGDEMTSENGLIVAYLLNGEGGGHRIEWDEIKTWKPERGFLWVHLCYTDSAARQWVRDQSGLDELIGEALLVEESRPRSLMTRSGLLAVLRGVNLNPGADPEDMVSIRIWIDQYRVISVRKTHLLSVDDLRGGIEKGEGPRTPGEFLADISERLVSRMAGVISKLEEDVDDLEQEVLTAASQDVRKKLAEIRSEAIMLRRYLAPQRDAMARLCTEKVDWLSDMDRMQLREQADRTMRYIEDLDAARERAAVSQDELVNRISEQMNSRMYLLSMVAAVFLPLGFLTGLLGVNVGGIPGMEYKWGFALVCVLILVLAALQFWYFKRKRWI